MRTLFTCLLVVLVMGFASGQGLKRVCDGDVNPVEQIDGAVRMM